MRTVQIKHVITLHAVLPVAWLLLSSSLYAVSTSYTPCVDSAVYWPVLQTPVSRRLLVQPVGSSHCCDSGLSYSAVVSDDDVGAFLCPNKHTKRAV